MVKHHADHLVQTIKENYQLLTYWEGQRYYEISIKLIFQKGVVELSTPGYVKVTLHKFQHS